MTDNNIWSFEKGGRAEKILDEIESYLRSLIKEKKEIKKNFLDKLREIEEQNRKNQDWFEDNWKEAERIENRLILLWDYWRREVEILALERKMQFGVTPTEREKIMQEIKKLNDFNITLEQGFKRRKIDADVIEELRKKLGDWDKDSERD